MGPHAQTLGGPAADRVTAPPANRVPPSAPSPRRLFAIAVFAALLGLGITLSFGYAEHDPKPHEVRVAVAAAPAVRAKVAAGLQQAEPGGFDLVSVPQPPGRDSERALADERRGVDRAPERRGHDRDGRRGRRPAAAGDHGRAHSGVAVDASSHETARRRPAVERRPQPGCRASFSVSGCSFPA